MKLYQLKQEQDLPMSMAEAWEFFSSPKNLEEITPGDVPFEIISGGDGKTFEGQIIAYKVGIAPGIRVGWVTEITSVDEGRSFIDEQRFGPYKFWHHRHTFEAIDGGVRMCDHVQYGLPLGWIGQVVHALFVGAKLRSIFAFRREILQQKFGTLDA
ncbi:SRPBCC family protein [Luteolibacter pohnpeiensis]|uniref:SRPBCC family protein n=1 Tax=Luteolibacter pohnpeiensis TaxID=454153 RepID=A0A934S6J8_9BACT|nr:SRPBCC family protein [Luteolibacter pohnpeiensis]MBK1882793.1 SRPBCC family protein [Luteolibacter pohnpeiensis]